MNQPHNTASIPVSWLRRMPEGYKQPLWRWILLPASALMVRHYGGTWSSGVLELRETALFFTPTKASALFTRGLTAWQIPFGDIRDVEFNRGAASETILIHHTHGTEKILSARSEPFFNALREAITKAS